MNFDRTTIRLNFRSSKTQELIEACFDPVFFSVSDEWVEDHTRVGSDKMKIQLKDFITDIESSWPGEGKQFEKAELYFANAMEWSIRFVSYEAPIVSLTHEKDLPNAY